MNAQSWVDLKQDADTGIEVIRAHFEGHAYDPHWHDSYLIGFTEQGVQQFHCRRALFSSVPGQTFFLEPGDIHDGHAPTPGGFTYSTLYLEPAWLEKALPGLFEQAPADCLPGVPRTQPDDPGLLPCIANALQALRDGEPRMVRDATLDALLERISRSLHWRQRLSGNPQIASVALRARDYLHAHFHQNIGLDELAQVCGVDRRQGFAQGAGLQLINPKTWLMSVSVTAIFLDGQASFGAVASYATLFLLVSTPCLLVWGVLGVGGARLLRQPARLLLFNRSMALLLLASVWLPPLASL